MQNADAISFLIFYCFKPVVLPWILRYNEIIVLEDKILGEGKYGTYYY